MPFHITYNEADAIVECVYEPPFVRSDFPAALRENLQFAAEHGALLFLGDCRMLTAAADIFDVYAMVEELDTLNVDRRMREALIIPPDPRSEQAFDFFVTATSNRGLTAAVFTDEGRAREWLREQGEQIRKAAG